MRSWHDRDGLGFFFFWAMVYLLAQNAGYALSQAAGVDFLAEAALNLTLSLFLYSWLRKEGSKAAYGLRSIGVPAKKLLYFMPLVFISTYNLWNGAAVNMPWGKAALYLISMGCVGFLEELLVRGFLFVHLEKTSVRRAAAVSTLAFGAAHLLNLFSSGGMTLSDTLFQVAFALGAGLLYAALLITGGSLWPCIFSHSAINMLSAFTDRAGLTPERQLLLSGLHIACMLAYAAALMRLNRKEK